MRIYPTAPRMLMMMAALVATLYMCADAKAQQPFTLQFGADSYGAAKVPNGSICVLVGDRTRAGVVADLRPTNVIGQFTWAVRAPFEQTVYRTAAIEFHAIGQAGIAQSQTAFGGIFSGGAGTVITASKLKGWNPFVNAEVEIAPTEKESPKLSLRAGVQKIFGQ